MAFECDHIHTQEATGTGESSYSWCVFCFVFVAVSFNGRTITV